ncbi:MAG: hypothetical protein GX023_03320 [Tissierellia bacterium]|nr:hypothetical protein [Tissierellia bacterium]
METRMERRKRLKKEKNRKILKSIILLSTLLLLYIGIKIVNKNIVYLGYLDNPNIFNIDIGEGSLELFGKNYIIDLKILKKKH